MLYFSSLVGKNVYSHDHLLIGSIADCSFVASTPPKITKFFIRTDSGSNYYIDTKYLSASNGAIFLQKGFKKSVRSDEGEMLLKQALLDKQIIDIEGRKVVRVNDLSITKQGNVLYLGGADVSFLALLRWIFLEKPVIKIGEYLGKNMQPNILTWDQIQLLDLTGGKIKLNTLADNITKLAPEDLADYLESTTIKNILATLDQVDGEFRSSVISELNLTHQVALFEEFNNEMAYKVLQYMESDEIVDILLELSKYRRQKILAKFALEKKQELSELISLSKHGIGKLLSSEFLSLDAKSYIPVVISTIRQEADNFAHLSSVYFVNKHRKLMGVMSMHELIIASPAQKAEDVMQKNIVIAYLNTPLEIVYKRMLKYNLSQLPILSKNKEILGIVTFDDVANNLLKIQN